MSEYKELEHSCSLEEHSIDLIFEKFFTHIKSSSFASDDLHILYRSNPNQRAIEYICKFNEISDSRLK